MAKRTCSEDGCERAHRARGLCAYHWRLQYGKRTKYPITCQVCGADWRSNSPNGRFCSDACKGEAYRVERRKYSRELVPVTTGASCSLPADHPVQRYAATQVQPGRWWTVFTSGPCAWCRETFTVRTTTRASYCSERCADNAARARRGGRFIIPAWRRLALYERDEWTCQLCLEPVDRDLMTTDPSNAWAPTLDHIRCQSWTNEPDHSDENLRLAHRWCNSVRADESIYSTDVLRIPSVA